MDIIQKLRLDLASQLGVEKTPDEVHDILDRAVALYDIVGIDCYRYMRDLTPDQCLIECQKQHCDTLDEFLAARDILLFVGERKYQDEPKRSDKPFLWDR